MRNRTIVILILKINLVEDESTAAVEYTDCFSAGGWGKTLLPNKSPGHDTKLHLMVRLLS